MKSQAIAAKETRYEYAGTELNGWFEQVPLKFPDRDAIWALGTGQDGRIYIGLAGEHNKGTAGLACYDPRTGKSSMVCDVGKFLGEPSRVGRMPHSKIHFAICPVGRHIWFGTHISGAFGRDDLHGIVGRGPIADTVSGYEGGRLLRYDTKTGKTEQFGIIVPNEGIRCMDVTADGRYAYGISYPKHRFFMRDLRTGETYVSARIGRYGGIDVFIDSKGRPWGAHDGHEGTRPGQMYYFDPATRRIVDVDAFLPRSHRRGMSFPLFGNHVLHMTATPDDQAMVSSYGESRIALFDPRTLKVYDWGTVWNQAPIQDSDEKERHWRPPHAKGKGRHKHPHTHRHHSRPDFAWSPAFDPEGGRTVEGKDYDRLVWYGEERWEYEENVRLCAIAYNHNRPHEIVKIRFGTPVAGKHPAGHWAASTVGPDGRIYFADRVRGTSGDGHHGYVQLRLSIFTPPKDLGPLKLAGMPK